MNLFGAMILSMFITSSPTSRFFVYLLHHPESQHIYVGKTTKGVRRLQEHEFPSVLKRPRFPVVKWVKSLHERGLEPQAVILEEHAGAEQLSDAECFFIAYYRALGFPLLNCTDGGEGVSGHKLSEKTRARLSESYRARMTPEERKARMTAIAKAYWSNPEARAKQRKALKGRKRPSEVAAKISAGLKGKAKSENHRAALSQVMTAVATPEWKEKQSKIQKAAVTAETRKRSAIGARDAWASEEYRQKRELNSGETSARLSVVLTGKTKSEIHRERIGDASRAMWADPEIRARILSSRRKNREKKAGSDDKDPV